MTNIVLQRLYGKKDLFYCVRDLLEDEFLLNNGAIAPNIESNIETESHVIKLGSEHTSHSARFDKITHVLKKELEAWQQSKQVYLALALHILPRQYYLRVQGQMPLHIPKDTQPVLFQVKSHHFISNEMVYEVLCAHGYEGFEPRLERFQDLFTKIFHQCFPREQQYQRITE